MKKKMTCRDCGKTEIIIIEYAADLDTDCLLPVCKHCGGWLE